MNLVEHFEDRLKAVKDPFYWALCRQVILEAVYEAYIRDIHLKFDKISWGASLDNISIVLYRDWGISLRESTYEEILDFPEVGIGYSDAIFGNIVSERKYGNFIIRARYSVSAKIPEEDMDLLIAIGKVTIKEETLKSFKLQCGA